jgi:hypothetical protein
MRYALTTIRGYVVGDDNPRFHHIAVKHFQNGISIPSLDNWLNISGKDSSSLRTFEFTIRMSHPLTPHRFRIYYTCCKTSLRFTKAKVNLVVCRVSKKLGNENHLVNMRTGDENYVWRGINL